MKWLLVDLLVLDLRFYSPYLEPFPFQFLPEQKLKHVQEIVVDVVLPQEKLLLVIVYGKKFRN